ncbi:hypothetical protein CPB85DRAFT_1456136 [Mucidula mucida]|nr:hypothetical protein CPB85DRAFT_1456136 [Mucidula mucida]
MHTPPSADPRSSVRPISLYTAPVRVRTHLFKSTAKPAPGETIQTRTPLDDDFDDFLSSPGTVWVDKMASVYSLCPLIHSKLALVRRPAGLGRTAFLRAAMRAHESYTPHDFYHLFGISPVCRLDSSTPQVTLNLNMGLAFDYSLSGSMECRIKHYMNCHLEILLNKVGASLGLSSGDIDSLLEYDSRKTFQNIIYYLRDAVKLVILVDDFNWPLIHSTTPEDAFEAAFLLDAYVVRPIRDALDQQFVAGGILLGRPIEDEPAWVHSSYKGDALFTPIACDITHDNRVRGAFGFSLPQVTSLAEELLEDLDVQLSFIDEVKASEPAYRHEEYIEYSMSDVLCRLRQRTGQPGLEEEGLYHYCDTDSEGSESDDEENIEMDEVEIVLGIST